MSQSENQFENPAYQEIETGNAPGYGAPPPPRPPQQDIPTEPARMNWLSRWFGVLISLGETFTDVNRKPTILAPILILIVVAVASAAVVQWKLGPYMPELLRTQTKKNMERFGRTLTEQELTDQVNGALMFQKFSPLFAAAVTPIFYLILAGIFALGMLLIQAKTTFKRIYSVTLWTFAGISVLSSIVFVASMMVKDDEALRSINLNNPAETVPTNAAVFLPQGTSPILKSLIGSFDIFTIWTIALLAIGLAAIANSRNVKTGKTATMILILWGVFVLGKMGLANFFG